MSRYSVTTEKNGSKYTVDYGFDNPSEYFIHVRKGNKVVFAVASYNSLKAHPDFPTKLRWSNSELLELMKAWGVPEKHTSRIAMDLPF